MPRFGFLVRLMALCAMLLAAPAAFAAQPWDAAAFAKAQEAGSPILIHVTAPWCPTCKLQKPTVDKLEGANPALKVFAVDFDTQKDVMKRFGVEMQSTLVGFHGKTEIGRVVGSTDPAEITGLVVRASH